MTRNYEKELAFEINNIETLESSFAETETSQNNLDDPSFEAKLEAQFENIALKSPVSDKNPIYAEVNKLKKTSNQVRIHNQPVPNQLFINYFY